MRRPRPRWLVVPALVLLAWATTPRDAPRSYRWEDRSVSNAEELILAAERDLLAGVADGTVVGPTTGCWFSHPAEATERLNPFLRCGPVLHAGGDPGSPWDTYPIEGLADGRRVRLQVAGPPRRGGRFPTGEALSRPDREAPPGADPERLEPPPPPRLSAGFAALVSRLDGADLRPVDGGLVGPEESEVRLTGLGRVETTDLGGEPRRAPAGEELLVASLTVKGRVEGVSAEVVSGDRRVPLATPLRAGRQHLVAAVPVGAEAALEVAYGAVSQALSLRTGERLPGGPALLYAPLRTELGVVVPRQQLDPGGGASPVGLAEYRIGTARLVAHAPWLGWADPGAGWLVVDLGSLQAPFVLDAAVRVDLERSFSLVLEDGRAVVPTDVARSGLEGTLVAFAVPESLPQATLRVAPAFDVTGPDRARTTLTFAAVEVRIAF